MAGKPKGERRLTGAERQRAWRQRTEQAQKRRDDTLAKIAESSTDPWAKKVARMALEGEVE